MDILVGLQTECKESDRPNQDAVTYLSPAERSLQLIKQCEADDADVLEVNMAQGIILKHAGDLDGAAVACFKAQSLDQADRSASVGILMTLPMYTFTCILVIE